jgi:hypothetical protein
MKYRIVVLLFTVHCALYIQAQEFSGYVSDMPSVIWQNQSSDMWWQNLLHNRLNFGWQLSKNWRIDAGMRNRFMTGSEAMLDPASAGFDNGWADLSWNWVTGQKALGNTTFDRLHITFEKDKWKLQLGRQRINWGQTFVWNPNDIFNTYSFFDFDYPERPGCDALRATYFHNETASSELAASLNHDGKLTAALLHHWNWKNFDYQLIAGEQNETDLVVGGAWTGDFNGLNFRGEFSYFHPLENLADTGGTVALSVGVDYIFSNSLMLQAEVLYNNVGSAFSGNGLMGLYAAPLSAKYLSICDWNVFAQASYPVTPRLNASLSGMYFVDIRACYAGLSLDYSVIENLDFSFVTQFFSTVGNSDLGNMQFLLGFARLKYSF